MPSLAELLTQFSTSAADGVADIADAETTAQKHKKFLLLLALMHDFGGQANQSLIAAVHKAVEQAQNKNIAALPAELRQQSIITFEQYSKFGTQAVSDAVKRLKLVLQNIQATAARLRTGRGESFLRKLLGLKSKDSVSDSSARAALRKRIVVVRGADGRDRSYDPSHYGALLEDGATGSAKKDTSIAMAENIGSDLVEMSPPTGKDYCDLWASQIYSISGTDPRVFPVRIIPNSGPPMHPGCVHVLRPIPQDLYSDAELRKRSTLPHEFVTLASSGKATIADFQRLFLQKSPKEWGL